MKQVARILQLTDLHLFGDRQKKLLGINPLQTLQQVVAKISADITKNPPDLIVLTGDISQDYSLESYKIAAETLKNLSCQIAITMGNHDHLEQFTKVFNSQDQIVNINKTNWRVIILNSYWPNHIGGQLTDKELTFLQENLSANQNQPVIIFLHHHVLLSGSSWLDSIKLENSSQFLEIIDQHNNVKAVVCGHIHQNVTYVRRDVLFLSTPSTSWQFLVNSPSFKLDPIMPGYRWINLYEDGNIQTEVVRIPHNDAFIPDVTSPGY